MLSPLAEAEYRKPNFAEFTAMRLDLPGYQVRLLTASAAIRLNNAIYTGRDEVYGTLTIGAGFREALASEAPEVEITLKPGTDDACERLITGDVQGSRVKFWMGPLDRATGLPIGEPDEVFFGILNAGRREYDQHENRVVLTIASFQEEFFAGDEAIRLSDQFHQLVWPGELGLQFNVDALNDPFWGAANPGGNIVNTSGGSAGTGGGGSYVGGSAGGQVVSV